MARRKRRNHSSSFKAKVALEALRGELTLAEIAEKYDLHTNQINVKFISRLYQYVNLS